MSIMPFIFIFKIILFKFTKANEPDNEIQILSNIIIISPPNYRYININTNKKGDLVILTTKTAGTGERLFYGLRENGRSLFKNDNSNEYPYLIFNISGEEGNQKKFNSESFFIQLSNCDNSVDENEYYLSVAKDDQYTEMFDFENENNNFMRTMELFEHKIYSDRWSIIRLFGEDDKKNYNYLLASINKKENEDKFKLYLKKIYFNYKLLSEFNEVDETTEIECKENKMVSCFQTDKGKIVCFYRAKSKEEEDEDLTYYTISTFDSELSNDDTIQIEESNSSLAFYKGIHLKEEVGFFLYFLGIKLSRPYVVFKSIDSDGKIKDYNSIRTLHVDFFTIFRYDYMLNDIIKFSNSSVFYVSCAENKEKFFYVNISLLSDNKKVNMRFYHQLIREQNKYSIFKDIRLSLYKNQFITVGASICPLSCNCLDDDSEHYTSFFIYSYPNSTDVNFTLTKQLYESNGEITDISFNLEQYTRIENNLLAYVVKGIKIINFPDSIKLISTKTNSKINKGDILSENENFTISFLSDSNYASNHYCIEYALVATEKDFYIANAYSLKFDTQYGDQELDHSTFGGGTYIGRTSKFNIIIDDELSTNCDNYCSLCLLNDKTYCLSCKDEFHFEGGERKCAGSKKITTDVLDLTSTDAITQFNSPFNTALNSHRISSPNAYFTSISESNYLTSQIKSTSPIFPSSIKSIPFSFSNSLNTSYISNYISDHSNNSTVIHSSIPIDSSIKSSYNSLSLSLPSSHLSTSSISTSSISTSSISTSSISTSSISTSSISTSSISTSSISTSSISTSSISTSSISTSSISTSSISTSSISTSSISTSSISTYSISTSSISTSSISTSSISTSSISASSISTSSISTSSISTSSIIIFSSIPNTQKSSSFSSSFISHYSTNNFSTKTSTTNIKSYSTIISSLIIKYDCSKEKILENKCKEGTITNEQIKDIYNDIKNELINKEYNKENKIYETQNAKFQISLSEDQKSQNKPNISSIDLGECEKIIKRKVEGLKEDDELIIFKTDIRDDNIKSTYVQFEIYHPYTLEKIELDICNNIDININVPIYFEENTQKISQRLNESGYNIFDEEDKFYNDICTKFTTDSGTDIILKDRRNDIYNLANNISLCQKGCNFQYYNFKLNQAKCKCQIVPKTSFTSDFNDIKIYFGSRNNIYNIFRKSMSLSNIQVMKCYKLAFDFTDIIYNYGCIFMTILFLFLIICMLKYFIKDKEKVNYYLKNILNQNYFPTHINNSSTKIKKINEQKPIKSNNEQSKKIKVKNNFIIHKKPQKLTDIKSVPPKKNKLLKNERNKHNKKKNSDNQSSTRILKAKSLVINNLFFNKNSNTEMSVSGEKTKLKNNMIKSKKSFNMKNLKSKKSFNIKNLKSGKTINKDFFKSKKSISNDIFKSKKSINNEIFKSRKTINNKISKSRNTLTNRDLKSKNSIINNKNNKIRKNILLNDYEMDTLNYKDAIKFDKRTYFEYYFSLLKRKHIILFAFFPNNDYNIVTIKISLFILSLSWYFTINALFFTDDSMHNIYSNNGEFIIFNQLPKILCSAFISLTIQKILKLLCISEYDILKIKREKTLIIAKKKSHDIKKCLYRKFLIFFILSFCCMAVFWYFITCFCAVYANTQIILIKDILISYGISMIYPFLINLVPGIFRIRSLKASKKDKEFVYRIGNLVAII